jgi:hypothetical protein
VLDPEAIPQYTGDLEQLEKDYAVLKADAGHVRDAGRDVHNRFQGLSAYYTAPEAEQLFATTKPVKDRADTFAVGLETVSAALAAYATEIRPLAKKLEQLKQEATTFVHSVKDDDDWEYDGDKVAHHNRIRDEVTRTVAAFWAAERTCHNKITALWHGTQMVAGDGSKKADQYGFDAEDLKNAKLPWGDPVEEKHHWWEVGHWVKSFVWDGIIVDSVWGTIKGLGTLVGFGGWEAMGQAWKGLAQLATGLVISSLPGTQAMFWGLPDDKLPSWLRDSRRAMKETGKALVAWDEWGKNPVRAAGGLTFNVVTTVFTGGAGAAAADAGKAGAVAKALSAAGKAAEVIDPMTYVAKGAGAGLSKIGDIAKALKGVGHIDIPELPENAITLPEGSVKLPDGTVQLPEGSSIPEGATKLPDGTIALPHGTPVLPEGTNKLPSVDGSPAQYLDPHGNLLDHQGNIVQHADQAPTDIADKPDAGTPATGTDTSHAPTTAQEPALAAANTPTVGRAGEHIGLDNSAHEGIPHGAGHALSAEGHTAAPHAAHSPETGGHGDSTGHGDAHHGGAGQDGTPDSREHDSSPHGRHETGTTNADSGHHPWGHEISGDNPAGHSAGQDTAHASAPADGTGLEGRGTPTPTPQTHPLGQNRDGFSIMRADDPFYREALKSKPLPGHYDVVAHGTPHNTLMDTAGGRELTPRQMADILRRRPDYAPGTPVRLLSCNTGHLDGSFAAQLARDLNAPVIAPDGFLYADRWGRFGVHRDRLLFVNNVPALPNTFYRYHPGGYVEEIPRSEWAVD